MDTSNIEKYFNTHNIINAYKLNNKTMALLNNNLLIYLYRTEMEMQLQVNTILTDYYKYRKDVLPEIGVDYEFYGRFVDNGYWLDCAFFDGSGNFLYGMTPPPMREKVFAENSLIYNIKQPFILNYGCFIEKIK